MDEAIRGYAVRLEEQSANVPSKQQCSETQTTPNLP